VLFWTWSCIGGKGSGLQFLADLKQTDIARRPIIVVTTNSSSYAVYNHVHDMGADLVFYKKQADYNENMVVDTLLSLRKSLHDMWSSNSNMLDDLQEIEAPDN